MTVMVNSVAFAPEDGRAPGATPATASAPLPAQGRDHLAVLSLDSRATVRDAASGDEIVTLAGPVSGPAAIAYSPDGRLLATPNADGRAKVWDAATGRELLALQGSGSITGLAFLPPAGEHGGTGARGQASSGAQVAFLPGGAGAPSPGSTSPCAGTAQALTGECGTLLAAGGSDGVVQVWLIPAPSGPTGTPPAARLELTLPAHQGRIWSLASALTPGSGADGLRLATSGPDGTVKVWQISGASPRPSRREAARTACGWPPAAPTGP
jgi:WD40 repeat protein